MTMFNEREKSFEAKFQHDQELLFRIQNRRNRLLGLWAAELMGLKNGDVDAYARDVVAASIEGGRKEAVRDKVAADLRARDVDLSDHRLDRKMDELLQVAHDQIMTEGGR